MNEKTNLRQLSESLERYSPNDYYDYMPNENAENINVNSTTDNMNNNTTTENNNVSAVSSANQAMENTADSAGLLALLTEWDLACLYRQCIGEQTRIYIIRV